MENTEGVGSGSHCAEERAHSGERLSCCPSWLLLPRWPLAFEFDDTPGKADSGGGGESSLGACGGEVGGRSVAHVVLVQVLALLLRLGPEGGEALHTGR